MGSNRGVRQLNNEIAVSLLGQLAMDFLDCIQDLARAVAIPIQPQNPIAKQTEEPTLNTELADWFVTSLGEPRHQVFKRLLIETLVKLSDRIPKALRLARRILKTLFVFEQQIGNDAVLTHELATFVAIVAEETNAGGNRRTTRRINFSSGVECRAQIVCIRAPLSAHHLAQIRQGLVLLLTTQQQFGRTN